MAHLVGHLVMRFSSLGGVARMIQYWLLTTTYHVTNLLRRGRAARRGVLVGLEENAGILHHLALAIPGSISVKSNANPLYSHDYDVDMSRWSLPFRHLFAPIVLGKLMPRVHTAVYVGGSGFLLSGDGREREFSFLQRHGVRIICQFTGTDIRSHRLLEELSARLDRDVITTYQGVANPAISGPRAERRRRALAESADRHADAIFNPSVDQVAYLRRETLPFLYFFPDDQIAESPDKWRSVDRLIVVHAPTSPIIKGTPLVRAAIKALKEDGVDFEYIEITARPNSEVREILRTAHVVLNQFYAFVPGVLGVEAMAANAVLLTSADPDIEPTLGPDSERAWVVTPYWRIYDVLRETLSDRESLQAQADRGTAWVRDNCSASACLKALMAQLGPAGPTSSR